MKQAVTSFRRVLALTAAATTAISCTGAIGTRQAGGPAAGDTAMDQAAARPGGRPGAGVAAPGGGAPGAPGAPAAAGEPSAPPASVGVTPLRRLSRLEYNNAVRDLLGDTSRPGDQLPDDPSGAAGFSTGGVVSPVEARALMAAARAVAANAVKRLPALLPCDPARAGEDACARQFVERFGKRLFRRPLAAEETADLLALYGWARREQALPFPEAVRVVLQGLLQAPSFLYRVEVGLPAAPGARIARLTPHETAARLSFFLWASTPDDALLAEADAGRLAAPGEVAAQARRLLADPRAADALRAFHADWLALHEIATLEKDARRFPDFTAAARQAMQVETPAFAVEVYLKGDGRLDTLLLADFTFADAALAKIYGVPAPAQKGLQRVTLDPGQGRAGLLTHLGVLASGGTPSSTSPIRRGKLVREQLLCLDLPPPPPGVDTTPPIPDPNVPVREQFRQHSDDAACRGCHALIDPIGFAFESFDSIGRHRATDGGKPVDASGEIVGTPASDGKFVGARELAARLAGSPDTQRCLARQWFRFALGRPERDDGPSLDRAFASFAGAGRDLRALLVALTQTPAFSYKALPSNEVMP
jgi:hypothetical protein